MAKTVYMKTPDGRTVGVNEDYLDKYLNKGYTIDTSRNSLLTLNKIKSNNNAQTTSPTYNLNNKSTNKQTEQLYEQNPFNRYGLQNVVETDNAYMITDAKGRKMTISKKAIERNGLQTYIDEYGNFINRYSKSDNDNYSNTNSSNSSSYSSYDIMDAITKLADSQFNQAANNLRQRVANIIAGYTNQLKSIPSQYLEAYQQADKSAYQQEQLTKAILNQAGLLNSSGVQVGNEQANALRAAEARQAIDLQKQRQIDAINNSILDVERNLQYDLNNLELEKANFINQSTLQEMRDIRDIIRDDYWRAREADLAEAQFDWNKYMSQQQLDWQKESFQKQLDYNYAALNQAQEQFKAQMEQKYKEFDFEVKKWTETEARIAKQFDETMGWNKEQFYAQMALENAKLEQAWIIAQMSNAIERERIRANLQLEREQFAKEFELALKELGLKEKQSWMDENDSLDAKIFKALEEGRDNDFIIALIDTSRLPFTAKEAKKRMIINSITGQSGSVGTGIQQRTYTPSNQVGNWGFQSGALSEYLK